MAAPVGVDPFAAQAGMPAEDPFRGGGEMDPNVEGEDGDRGLGKKLAIGAGVVGVAVVGAAVVGGGAYYVHKQHKKSEAKKAAAGVAGDHRELETAGNPYDPNARAMDQVNPYGAPAYGDPYGQQPQYGGAPPYGSVPQYGSNPQLAAAPYNSAPAYTAAPQYNSFGAPPQYNSYGNVYENPAPYGQHGYGQPAPFGAPPPGQCYAPAYGAPTAYNPYGPQ